MRIDELFLNEDFLPGAAVGRFTGLWGSRLFVQSDVTAEEARAFADRLREAGFATLQRRETNGMRYYALQKAPYTAHLLHSPTENELRVCLAAQETVPRLTPDTCEGDGNTVFYAFENDQTLIDCGMCLMVECPDHSFFMVDSGHYFQPNDNDRIYRFLRERTPKGQKVRVCGWLITHAHTDHVCKLMDFLKYNTDDVVIEGFYHNLLPPDYAIWDGNHEEAHIAAKLLAALADYPAPVYTLHTGMRFYVRSLAFDVLSTHEDLHPAFIDDYNDSRHFRECFSAFSCCLHLFELFVISVQIPDTHCRKLVVAAHHFTDCPVQGSGRFLRIIHDRNHQVRNPVVNGQFNFLRIDHDEFQIVRRNLVKQTDNQCINAH